MVGKISQFNKISKSKTGSLGQKAEFFVASQNTTLNVKAKKINSVYNQDQ